MYSEHPGKEFGKFKLTSGKFYNNAEQDKGIDVILPLNVSVEDPYLLFTCLSGIQTSEDAKFYAVSRKFSPFSNKDKPLVIQFTVKHEQNIDCGGGYVKLFDCSLDQKDMHGETPYLIMFGTKDTSLLFSILFVFPTFLLLKFVYLTCGLSHVFFISLLLLALIS